MITKVNVRRHYAKINVTKMKVTKNEGPYCGNKNNVVRAVRCSQECNRANWLAFMWPLMLQGGLYDHPKFLPVVCKEIVQK